MILKFIYNLFLIEIIVVALYKKAIDLFKVLFDKIL